MSDSRRRSSAVILPPFAIFEDEDLSTQMLRVEEDDDMYSTGLATPLKALLMLRSLRGELYPSTEQQMFQGDDDCPKLSDDPARRLDWCIAQFAELVQNAQASETTYEEQLKQIADRDHVDEDVVEWVTSTYTESRRESTASSFEFRASSPTPRAKSKLRSSQSAPSAGSDASSLSMQSLAQMIPEEFSPAPGEPPVFEAGADATTCLENALSWSFDVFRLQTITEDRPLVAICHYVAEQWDLYESLGLDVNTCLRFFTKLEDGYGRFPTPIYHNNLHGADVVQATFHLLSDERIHPIFSKLHLFSALVAAAGHDVGHPGYNNQFLMATNDSLALLYNDHSVLENHHCALTFKALREPGCDILATFNTDQKLNFRSEVVNMILNTDMAKHFHNVAEVRSFVEKRMAMVGKNNVVNLDSLSIKDISVILYTAIHCADLSAQTRTWDISQRWAERILSEFFSQGDREKELKLPVGPLNDRTKVKPAKAQIGFLDFIVIPLWEAWGMLLGNTDTEFMQNLVVNRDRYKQAQDKEPDEVQGKERAKKNMMMLAKRARGVARTMTMLKAMRSSVSASSDGEPSLRKSSLLAAASKARAADAAESTEKTKE
eukprot:m.357411 g.357411  ORF g.357411 m.357411 type:complete len:605 (-) comp17822_c0_seq1:2045-3859(-)